MVTGRREFVTIRQIAERFGVEPVTIRSILCRHRAEFLEAIYVRRNGHPRLVRILTRKEAEQIRELIGLPPGR